MDNTLNKAQCNCDEMVEEEKFWECPVHGRMWFNTLTGEIEQNTDPEED